MRNDDIDKITPLSRKLAAACMGETYPTVILAAIMLAEWSAEQLIENGNEYKDPAELYDLALVASAKLQAARVLRRRGMQPRTDINRFIFRGEKS